MYIDAGSLGVTFMEGSEMKSEYHSEEGGGQREGKRRQRKLVSFCDILSLSPPPSSSPSSAVYLRGIIS
jgi:hypothetical protein